MTYQSQQWCGQYVIADRPDGLGVCRVEAGESSKKVIMVCDDEDYVVDDDNDGVVDLFFVSNICHGCC